MRIAAHYSHLNGLEWLKVERPGAWEQIVDVINGIDAACFRTKVSQEARMRGELKYSPGELNAELERRFKAAGWETGWEVDHWVTDDMKLMRQTVTKPAQEQKAMIKDAGKKPIRSSNEIDFVKDRVAIEVQFGKYSFVAYDMFVKHLAFYVADKIDCGIEILPTKAMQEHMSSGPGYYEWALHNIARQGRGSPPVPLVVIGIEP